MKAEILIIDGMNMFMRNYAVNPMMDSNGNPIGAMVGSIRSIKTLMSDIDPRRVFVVWDGIGGSKKRQGIYSDYKSGRKPRLNRELEETMQDGKDNLEWQRQGVKPLLNLLGVTQVEIGDIEADDVIAYLVGAMDPRSKIVVSSDKDMWQLVSSTTLIYWPTKKIYITSEEMVTNHSCLPENWIIMKALCGDKSDSIKGIGGIGPKTVKKLFPELSQRAFTIPQFFQLCEEKANENKKFGVILENTSLVNQNVEIMQLTSPIISATAAHVIGEAIARKPAFNFTAFKVAMMNKGIQLTDVDLIPTFKTYQMRIEREFEKHT